MNNSKITPKSDNLNLGVPSNVSAERALLAGILTDNRNMLEAEVLEVSDFYDFRHRQIFIRMKELYGQKKPIDVVTLDMINDDYACDLYDLPLGLINIPNYVQEIKETSGQRCLISRIEEIRAHALDSGFQETKAQLIELTDNLERNTATKFDFKIPSQVIAKKPDFFLEDFMPLPLGAVTMISAKGGSGKSALALQIGLRASAREIKTLAWFSEEPDYITKYRLEKISEFTGITIHDDYFNFTDQMPFQVLQRKYKEININSLFNEFKTACKDFQIIIIDPLIEFYGGNENDNGEARQFMHLLTEWAKNDNKSIVLIHHQTKYQDAGIARGAGAFVDAVRAQYSVEKDENDNKCVKVKIEKDNWGIGTQFGNEKSIQIFKENYVNLNKEKNDAKNKIANNNNSHNLQPLNI
jgi:replicative DNA helicase